MLEAINVNGIYEFTGRTNQTLETGQHVVAVAFMNCEGEFNVVVAAYLSNFKRVTVCVVSPEFLREVNRDCQCDTCWAFDNLSITESAREILDGSGHLYYSTQEELTDVSLSMDA